MDLIEKGEANVSLKHLNLDRRMKMNVKLAVQLMSRDVAMDLLQHTSHKVNDIFYTATYIHHCANYFAIMNSISLDQDYMHKLMKFLMFVTKWKEENDEDP